MVPVGSSGDGKPPQKQVEVLLTMPRETMALALAHSIVLQSDSSLDVGDKDGDISNVSCAF
jgi:hypothetical protein